MNTIPVYLVVWTSSDDPHSPTVAACLSKEEADRIAEAWKMNGHYDEEGYSEMNDTWIIPHVVNATIPDHLVNEFKISI